MGFREQIVNLLTEVTELPIEEVTLLLAIPPDQKMGDYSFPCFKIGGKKKADEIKEKIGETKFLSEIKVVGPYVNFYLNKSVLASEVLKRVWKEKARYGKDNFGNGKTIVIDFSAPNIAKPFGIGHLRSTVIGNSLYKVYQSLGYKVVGVNHLGDWGTQFGKMIVAYRLWGKGELLEEDPINYLFELYVRFNKEAEKNEDLNDQARAAFKEIEDGKPDALALWERFKQLSLNEFQRIYDILEISFDSGNGEAFYNDKIPAAIKRLEEKVLTEISEGALIFNLEKFKMPPVLLRKSNRTTTYHTRDLATAYYRLDTYNPERILYVVGSPQKLHFRQLFTMLKCVGLPEEKFVHVDFGLIQLPEGKMSTRKGNLILLDDILKKSISLASQIISEKNSELKDKEKIAQQIGVGAVIFADLGTDRIRDVIFDWDKMLSFEGETAPYIQYTHARASSILRKTTVKLNSNVIFDKLLTIEEYALLKKLYLFPEVIVTVAKSYKPHHLAHYLVGLAQSFNEFYHKHQVISEDKELMMARLMLVSCVKQVIANGLSLLGIHSPEEM